MPPVQPITNKMMFFQILVDNLRYRALKNAFGDLQSVDATRNVVIEALTSAMAAFKTSLSGISSGNWETLANDKRQNNTTDFINHAQSLGVIGEIQSHRRELTTGFLNNLRRNIFGALYRTAAIADAITNEGAYYAYAWAVCDDNNQHMRDFAQLAVDRKVFDVSNEVDLMQPFQNGAPLRERMRQVFVDSEMVQQCPNDASSSGSGTATTSSVIVAGIKKQAKANKHKEASIARVAASVADLSQATLTTTLASAGLTSEQQEDARKLCTRFAAFMYRRFRTIVNDSDYPFGVVGNQLLRVLKNFQGHLNADNVQCDQLNSAISNIEAASGRPIDYGTIAWPAGNSLPMLDVFTSNNILNVDNRGNRWFDPDVCADKNTAFLIAQTTDLAGVVNILNGLGIPVPTSTDLNTIVVYLDAFNRPRSVLALRSLNWVRSSPGGGIPDPPELNEFVRQFEGIMTSNGLNQNNGRINFNDFNEVELGNAIMNLVNSPTPGQRVFPGIQITAHDITSAAFMRLLQAYQSQLGNAFTWYRNAVEVIRNAGMFDRNNNDKQGTPGTENRICKFQTVKQMVENCRTTNRTNDGDLSFLWESGEFQEVQRDIDRTIRQYVNDNVVNFVGRKFNTFFR